MTPLRTLLVLLVAAGATVTVFWFVKGAGASQNAPALLVVGATLGGVSVLTVVNLVLRWLRWHFLLRRFETRIRTPDSFALFFATLPLMFTPFYVGEVLRAGLLYRRYLTANRAVLGTWVIERGTDVAVLVLLWLLSQQRWLLLAGAAGLVLGLTFVFWRFTGRSPHSSGGRRRLELGLFTGALLLPTALAWTMPILALWAVVGLLGQLTAIGVPVEVFVRSTLLGGVTGVPLGVGVTGTTAIQMLIERGIGSSAAIWSIAIWRAGTAWFALALGVVVLLIARQRLRQLLRRSSPAAHFDEIAPLYAEQLPVHVRDRLLSRKLDLICHELTLHGAGGGARGLDLGCGQGWYACEMAARGYQMVGVDMSSGQLEAARRNAGERGLEVEFRRANAAELDLPGQSFDFVYSINLLHHVLDPTERIRLLGQVVRVLRPGGQFFLHEMNPSNPLFRFYLSYVFPLVKQIDEGNEEWISPRALPPVEGARWDSSVAFFTFLPDFLPGPLYRGLGGLEARLERSRLAAFSVHYMARLEKDGAAT